MDGQQKTPKELTKLYIIENALIGVNRMQQVSMIHRNIWSQNVVYDPADGPKWPFGTSPRILLETSSRRLIQPKILTMVAQVTHDQILGTDINGP